MRNILVGTNYVILFLFLFVCTYRAFILFIIYYLCQQMRTYIYIYIKILLHYITNAPTCFGTSVPPSGSFNIVFDKVIKY